MLNRRRLTAAAATAILATAGLASAASGHNAGHVHLPTGECLDVGSGKHNANADRYPDTPGDEYGARWAADQGNTVLYPRFCADPRNVGDHPGH